MNLRPFFWIIIAGMILPACGLFLQNSGLKNYRIKAKLPDTQFNDFQYDFLYLTQLVEKGFPKLESSFPQKERLALQEEILEKLKTKPNRANFLIQSTRFLARLENQHCRISLDLGAVKRYAFWVHIYQDDWFLMNVDRQVDSSYLGAEILSINGLPVEELEKKLYQFVFAENHISKQAAMRNFQFFNFPAVLMELGLIGSLEDSLYLELANNKKIRLKAHTDISQRLYRLRFKRHPISAKKNQTYFYQLYPEQDYGYLQFNNCHDSLDILDGIQTYVKPWLRPLARSYAKAQMKKLSQGKKKSSPISRYYNPNHPVFAEMIREMVDSLNKLQINKLVIDLRYNPGGNTIFAKQLLYFLTDGPLKDYREYIFTSELNQVYFKKEQRKFQQQYQAKNGYKPKQGEIYALNPAESFFADITDQRSLYHIESDRPIFKGKVFILANYNTGSAAALMTTLFQDNDMATIIGTSVSNNPTGATTWTPLKLPKSKASISIATSYRERPDREKGKIQMPDHWVEYSLEQLINGHDPFLQKALEVMRD